MSRTLSAEPHVAIFTRMILCQINVMRRWVWWYSWS